MDPSILPKRVDQFIKIRDKIREMETAHKEQLRPLREALDQLNTMLVGHLTEVGVDSMSIKNIGTVYKARKVSCTLGDAGAFRTYVVENQAWDLADWRANKTAVEDYVRDHQGETPPGVNVNTAIVAGVRRD
jgi:hypothetical protein